MRLLISLAEILEDQIFFEFQHDRVQQAVISTLDEQQLEEISLRIGRLLLAKSERAGQEVLQENLVTIVDHLNMGIALIEDPMEAVKVAQLNMLASDQARASAAFEVASRYLSTAMQILPAESWREQYGLTLEIYNAGAEVALQNGDLARAEALAFTAEENARTLLEKARIMKIRMDIYMIQTLLDRVFELGITIIKMLGFDLELSEPPILIPEQAMQLPEMTDPRALAVSQLDELMVASGYASNDPRMAQVVLFYMDLFARFGNPRTASYMYVSYAVILQLSRFEHMEQGCRLGRMALELAEKVAPSKTLYAVRYVYYGFVHHWWRSASECIRPLYESFQPAVKSGSIWYSISMQDLAAEISMFVGMRLEQVRSEQAEALSRVEFLDNVTYTQRLRMWSQVVINLMSETLHPQEVYGDLFREEEAQKLLSDGQNLQYMFYLYAAQAFLNLFFRDPQKAVESSIAAEAIKASAQNYLIYTVHLFIYSLALLSTDMDAGGLAARLEKVEANLQLMRLWANLVPENYLHQLELVEAEQARCLGREEEAADFYARAIRDARKNGYIHESALAAELAAEFYLARQDYPNAKSNLLSAYSAYLDWGARAKVNDLETRYPEWLPLGKDREKPEDFTADVEVRPSDIVNSSIDLNSILKASLELAHETNLEELLRKMMAILIENTGAQNGSLLLSQKDRWFLEVQGSAGPEQEFALLSIPLEYLSPQVGDPLVPTSIIHYVINLKVTLVLEDASASRQFKQDVYIRSRQPKSILCVPLLNQGVLFGVIYLENNLVTGAFTADRLEIVQLISSQAAISIEKARLYEDMEAQVRERTRALSDANRRLKAEINERIRAEKELRLSEERYRAVFENTGTAMMLVDPDGYIIITNEVFLRLTGYSREELENHFLAMDLIAPADQAEVRRQRVSLLEGTAGAPLNLEFRLFGRSGSEIAVIDNATLLPGLHYIIHSLIDISQRKSAEEALRYNEALLRRVLEVLPVGVWIIDRNSRILSGNPEAQRIWGGAKYVKLNEYGEYKAWRADSGEQVSEWAGSLAITQGKITLDEELEIDGFDGARRTILNSALPLFTEEDGLVGAISVNQDITKRKRDEEELQKAHAQLSTLLEISRLIVSTLDLEHLLNIVIEQVGKVLPYEGAAILIREQDFLKFRVIRGSPDFHSLINVAVPLEEPTLVDPLIKAKEPFYIPDLPDEPDVLKQIQMIIRLPLDGFSLMRSWLGQPLFARDDLVGFLVLTHSQPDFYSPQARIIAQAFGNQVAIAIQNAQLFKRSHEVATVEERSRLARELHNSVAQALYSISLFTDAMRRALKTNKLDVVSDHLDELVKLSRQAMSDMRLLIFELRPPILEKDGLLAALQSRLDSVKSRAGFQAQIDTEGIFQFTSEQESELYWIAIEVLNNVIKHAQASQVSVQLRADADRFRMIIADNGVGFDLAFAEQAGGQGLRNIRERAEKIGAACRIKSASRKGTKITIEINQ